MQDEQIIDLYFARNESAISESDTKYGGYVQSISHNILGDLEDAKECRSDTWLHAWNAMPPFHPEKLCAYFGKIARNLSLNRYEKEHAQKRGGSEVPGVIDELAECLADTNADVETQSEGKEITAVINDFLEELDPKKRALFVRRYFYASPVRDIAHDYEMRESAVKMQLLRMRGELKQQLMDHGINL